MKKQAHNYFLLIVFLAALIPAAMPSYDVEASGFVTVSIQPDAAAGLDTYILSSTPTTNYGTSAELAVGESNAADSKARTLITFDLTGLPYDMDVMSATLTLTVSSSALASNSGTLQVFGVYADWQEASATWNRRRSSASCFQGSCPWQVAGADGVNDYDNNALTNDGLPFGEVTIGASTAEGTQITINLNRILLENIRRGNYRGMVLRMASENNNLITFHSSDATILEKRPKLDLTYNPTGGMAKAVDWYCYDGAGYPDCLLMDGVPMRPFQMSGSRVGNYATLSQNLVASDLACDPYPTCKNDFPIYYRIEWKYRWTGLPNASAYSEPRFDLNMPGRSIIVMDYTACGSGTSAKCEGVVQGVIPVDQLPTTGAYMIGLEVNYNRGISYISEHFMEFDLYLSFEPFSEDCAATYYVPTPETLEIDPTIEFPIGDPDDEQMYETIPGKVYMVRVGGDTWNDGTEGGRLDAAVSFDGTTWTSWENFSANALCVNADIDDPENTDKQTIYFTAPGETFYIRANDLPGQFADNDVDGVEGFVAYTYTIGEAFLIADGSCSEQFSYDVTDLVASIQVYSEMSAVPAATDLQTGEWYAIELASGTWSEPPTNTPLKTMEYRFQLLGTFNNWYDLADGSQHVQCVQETQDGNYIAYVQAQMPYLDLRVDDQDGDWTNNTGTLGVNIYHATFQRPQDTCELNFAIDDLVRTDFVDARAEFGKVFGLAVGSALTNNNTQTENMLDYGLVPGATYALEIVGGPWGFKGSLHGDVARAYDMAIAVSDISSYNADTLFGPVDTNADDVWVPLDEWTQAVCNVETDLLGHRIVYFQVPVTTAVQYKLRVNDYENWNGNEGTMGWNLYRAHDLGPIDSGMCDYTYDPTPLNGTVQTVRADAVDGAYISDDATVPIMLLPNTFYAVELLGENYQWFEQNGSAARTDAQLSKNNGSTWGEIPGGGELCALEDGDNLIFFIRTGDKPQFKLRVNSESFADNYGFLGYNLYLAEAGSSILPDGCVTQGYTTTPLTPGEFIPVTAEEGIGIASTSGFAEFGGLIPGQKYIVETSRGPWYDGETEIEFQGTPPPGWNPLKDFYSAQVSSDGGVTWLPMNGTNPNVSCWEYTPDFKYYKIEFTVQEGQIWRIRVADTESDTFLDNTGSLSFTLKGLVLPDDPTAPGTFTLAGCNTPPLRPAFLTIADLQNLGNYFAQWFDYLVGSVVQFFAWCPDNTAAVTMFVADINTKEPFASLREFEGILNDIRNQLNGYSWGANTQDYSILNKTPAQASSMIEKYVLGDLPSDSPWIDGDLVDFSAPAPSNFYFTNCQLSLNDFVGPRLGAGACFSFNWAHNVGLMFYLQLMLDVAVMLGAAAWVMNKLRQVLYILTGVNTSIAKNMVNVVVNPTPSDSDYRGRRR